MQNNKTTRKSTLFALIAGILFLFLVLSGCDSTVGQRPGGADIDADRDFVEEEDGDSDIIEDEIESEDETAEEDEAEQQLIDGDEEEETPVEVDGDEDTTDTSEYDDDIDPVELDYDTALQERCDPGERICYGNKLKICNDDGKSWTRKLCSDDQICALDDCYDIVCEPGHVNCEDGNVTICNPEGTGRMLEDVCRPPFGCLDGVCVSSCESAIPIAKGQTLQGDTFERGNSLQGHSSCWESFGSTPMIGPDRLYVIDLVEGEAIQVRVTPSSRHFDTAVYLFEDCDKLPEGCMAGADSCCALTTDTLDFTAPSSGSYYIAVDSWEDRSGEYTIEIGDGVLEGYDIELTDLRHEVDPELGLVFFVNVKNNGPETVSDVEVSLTLDSAESPTADQLPHRMLVFPQIPPDTITEAVFRFPNARAGVYSTWAVADQTRKFYDPDRGNNSEGPDIFSIEEGPEEVELALPVETTGRIVNAGDAYYLRLSCLAGRVIMLRITTDEGVSSLDSAVTLYAADDLTIVEEVDRRSAGEEEELVFVCANDGRTRLKIAASENAQGNDTTGSFTVSAAGLSDLDVQPSRLQLFPGGERQLAVRGAFAPLVEEAELPIEGYCRYESYDPQAVTVSNAGLVVAGDEDRQRTFVIVTPTDPYVAAVPISVEVSTLIPGDVFLSEDPLPMDIPDYDRDGIDSVIHVAEGGVIESLTVGVSILHPDITHLKIDLTSPQGTLVRLHKGVQSGQNLVTIYGPLAAPEGPGKLEDFIGEDATGDWTLNIVDDDYANSGRLNTWRLIFIFE